MVFHCCEKFCIVLYLGKATFPVRDGSRVPYAIYSICRVSAAFHHDASSEASISSILELMEFWQGAWF
ncbi:hypothetical protein HanXRQr2_Chr13g0596771 [Helianthus annuus]|uniref:Uncharacterized protein n=1 Tax=Helianthus annuus TaxID=4232 RepID=A0A9K3HCL5_HELAN|nr:hypothetical protein HanXRQr2_Chr13g0596771 [Helianthus annuus]KAJ0849938.1 hypothetical protein HanPSC8_Chr13g0574751 [Helianthus annuus]